MEPPRRDWRIAEGRVLVYRLFDVCDAIDLERAEVLVPRPGRACASRRRRGPPRSRSRARRSTSRSAAELVAGPTAALDAAARAEAEEMAQDRR
jgi:hypothetical protein